MFNLFELMQKSQGGEAVQAMAKQFGLSPPQAESAMDALLPPSPSPCSARCRIPRP